MYVASSALSHSGSEESPPCISLCAFMVLVREQPQAASVPTKRTKHIPARRAFQDKVCPKCHAEGKHSKAQTSLWCNGMCKRHARAQGFAPCKRAAADKGVSEFAASAPETKGQDFAAVHIVPPLSPLGKAVRKGLLVICQGPTPVFNRPRRQQRSLVMPRKRLTAKRLADHNVAMQRTTERESEKALEEFGSFIASMEWGDIMAS